MVEEQPEEALMELIARFGQTLMRNREEAGKWAEEDVLLLT